MKPILRFLNKSLHPLLMMVGAMGLFCLTLFAFLQLAPAVAAQANETGGLHAVDCAGVMEAPKEECLVLVNLYSSTNGANWITQTNWPQENTPNAPCDWYGVRCAAGHVSEIRLAANRLNGRLPDSLGALAALTRLHLENNALTGAVPRTICELSDTVTDADFAYNALTTNKRQILDCLNQIDPDWRTTQTTAPRGLLPTELYTNSVRLSWKPISYTADGGYYEISTATAITGPYTLHGTTADKLAASYWVDGLEAGRTYYFMVRAYTPPHGEQFSELRGPDALIPAVTQALTGNVLLAAYFAADNDLSPYVPSVLNKLRFGTQLNPNVQVVILADGREEQDTRLLEIAHGEIITTNVVQQIWGRSELNTADPVVLAWFLHYARTHYPAMRQIASLLGHGVALAPEVDWPPPSVVDSLSAASANPMMRSPVGELPPLPREWTATPNDETDNGYMSTVDVGQALLAATNMGAHPFDLLFFDQCFQGNLDTLYEVRQTAKVFIASPNYAWLTAAYHRYLTQLIPSATPEELAQAIIDRYWVTLNNHHPNVIFWVTAADIEAIASGVSNLGEKLRIATQQGDIAPISRATRDSLYVDTTQCGEKNLVLGPPDELIGAESFARRLMTEFPPNDPAGVHAAADALYTLLDNIQRRLRVGRPYLNAEVVWNYRDTITLLAPLRRESRPDVAWRASLYRPDAPFTATWTLDPSQPVTVTASLAYVRDGQWDEFLAEWYEDLSPTVGQWCHYTPPEQVVDANADTDAISLTVTANSSNTLQLSWTPIDDDTASEYWLYRQAPDDVNWTMRKVIPIGQSSVEMPAEALGLYRFSLLARNSDYAVVAQSSEVEFEVTPGNNVTKQIFLPLIGR